MNEVDDDTMVYYTLGVYKKMQMGKKIMNIDQLMEIYSSIAVYFAELWKYLVGALLCGAVIKIKSFIKMKNVQNMKGNNNRAQQMGDSKNSNQYNVSICDSPNSKVLLPSKKASSEEEALSIPNLEQGSLYNPKIKFIVDETEKLFLRNGRSYPASALNDYCIAEQHRNNDQPRIAATLYIRVYSPIVTLLEVISKTSEATALSREIEKLETWSIEGHSLEKVGDVKENIEKLLFKLFQNGEYSGSN